jgi:hypothetical protein
MVALRSLRPLASALRNAPTSAARATVPLALASGQSGMRGYKRQPQPTRDMMTGEVISLPDIDVG